MKIKKLLKYLPITAMAAGLAVAATIPSLSLLNNSDHPKNQIFNVDQAVDETEYTDQLEYIRNDVAKQDGVTNSVKSIDITNEIGDGTSSYKQSSYLISSHSAAIVTKTDGSTLLYMWGSNNKGQLGNGGTTDTSTPTLVTALSDKKIKQFAIGGNHSAALLEDGSLYMWGYNGYGQLGNGTSGPSTDESVPTLVDSINFNGKKITQIALGELHSAALLEDGSLYMWGSNNSGRLGNGAYDNKPTPTLVTALSGQKITQIALGDSHSAALTEDGLYMWGYGGNGRLGSDSTSSTTPILVTALNDRTIAKVALGGGCSAAVLDDGSLYMWGYNGYGLLGNGGTIDTSTPTKVIGLDSKKITQIALGESFSAALLEDGSLYTWGRNNYGQLGFPANGDTSNPTPAKVDATPFSTNKITQIALGESFSAAILEDGSLFMWGENDGGQLGNEINVGTTTPNPTPTWMYKLGKDSHITANTTITAQAAVDNIWVDNKFNLTGFKNSFNLTNILETTDQEITMDTKPTYDNATGTVTMTVKIKYFYNEDGLLVPDADIGPMDISGFRAFPKTNITAKNDSPIVASDEAFMEMIYDADGKLNQVELAKFIDGLDTIPETATILSVDYISTNQATAIFQIKLSGYYDGTSVNMVNEEKSYDFEVRVEYTAPAVNDPFPWWWIIIGIGGAAIIGVGIWFIIKKRKEAEAKPTDGEPNSEKPRDDEKKTSESEAKTDNHPIDKPAEETKTEEASKPKSLKKSKK